MDHLLIRGGRRLEGQVAIEGAKNAALPMCVAPLLTDEPVRLHRIPHLRDVDTILSTISSLGKKIKYDGNTVEISCGGALRSEAEARYVEQMRASFLILGPLAARLGHAIVPLPGGCTIGRRPVDLHLGGLRAMGARIEEFPDRVVVKAEKLHGARISFPYPSVGATEHLLMTAALIRGETRITNPSREPEIGDLISLLRKMGAHIVVEKMSIRINGSEHLHGAEHTIIPDRLEAGTYLLAGAITGGEVQVTGVEPEHLRSVIEVLREAGMSITESSDTIRLLAEQRAEPGHIVTAPYPGFPTDLQPPLVALLCLGKGESLVEEQVFESRLAYAHSLNRMGGRIKVTGRKAIVAGVNTLVGAKVPALDIRAGGALILAGLAAEGETVIYYPEHIDRGYASIEQKLALIGARIERGE